MKPQLAILFPNNWSILPPRHGLSIMSKENMKPRSNQTTKTIDSLPIESRRYNNFCAEGYVFELERRGYLQAGPFVPVPCVLEHPEVVKQLHRDFVHAGSGMNFSSNANLKKKIVF